MDHQAIETANDPEILAIDREASRVAQRAAEVLRQSRAACLNAPVGLPTWTGKSGGAGAPERKPMIPSMRATGGMERAAGSGMLSSTSSVKLSVDGEGVCKVESLQSRRFGSVRNPALVSAASLDDNTTRATSTSLPPTGMLGSAALIARMKARQGTGLDPRQGSIGSSTAGGLDTSIHRSSAKTVPKTSVADSAVPLLLADPGFGADALMARLVSFLENSGGQAASNVLVEKFRDEVRISECGCHPIPHLLPQENLIHVESIFDCVIYPLTTPPCLTLPCHYFYLSHLRNAWLTPSPPFISPFRSLRP